MSTKLGEDYKSISVNSGDLIRSARRCDAELEHLLKESFSAKYRYKKSNYYCLNNNDNNW